MAEKGTRRYMAPLLVLAGCVMYMTSGGIRSNFGITFVCHQIGAFLSSCLGGVFITQSGNYQAVWLIDIALCAIAATASWRIRGSGNVEKACFEGRVNGSQFPQNGLKNGFLG